MKKRLLALLVSLSLGACMFTGCGSDDSSSSDATPTTAPTEAAEDAEDTEDADAEDTEDADAEASGNVLRLALNFYDINGSNTEGSDICEVTEDGQYTLTFNADTEGVNFADDSTLYIKDCDVTQGISATSAVTSCEIRYDSITADGTELTITNTDFNSVVNSSGIVDSGQPINGWDGSSVAEAEKAGNGINWTIDVPTEITVTFTVQNLVFAE